MVDVVVVNVALPSSMLQLTGVCYTVVFGSLLIVAGRAGDRYGRRRILRTGLVIFTADHAGSAGARAAGDQTGHGAASGLISTTRELGAATGLAVLAPFAAVLAADSPDDLSGVLGGDGTHLAGVRTGVRRTRTAANPSPNQHGGPTRQPRRR